MKQHFCMGMTVRNVYIIQMKNAYIIMTVNHRATIVITTRQKLEIEKLLVVRNHIRHLKPYKAINGIEAQRQNTFILVVAVPACALPA